MKNKVYVERYAKRLFSGDKSAVTELAQCFINELNADSKRMHVTTESEFNRLISEYNRKGNELAAMMRVKTGYHILNLNWFLSVVELIRDEDNKPAHNKKR